MKGSGNMARWFEGSRSNLAVRFNLVVGLTLIIFSCVSTYVGSQIERRSRVADLEKQALHVAKLIGSNLANSLFTFDQENINSVVQGFSSDPMIRLLEIKNNSGKVVAAKEASNQRERLITANHQIKIGGDVVGAVVLGLATTSVDEAMRDAWETLLIREGAAILVLFAVLAFLVRRAVSRPLKTLNDILERSQETGDLTLRMEIRRRDEIGKLGSRFNRFMETLQGLLAQVRGAAYGVTTASQQLSSASEQLSSGTQQQASSLEETAASLEEITGTVKQNADNAKQANQLAMGSRDVAEKGGRVVETAVLAMGEINKSSKKIADIITTIDEIAFQTNLLALNAAVEAARAGEQGRGFAVVAAEVRNLAQRSATAAKEIKALIQDSVAKVESGSELVTRSGQTLEEIVSSVKRVTDIIGEIAAASQEQTSGIDQVNRAVAQMDQVVQSNAAQTEETTSTAQSLAMQADQLQELVEKFKLGDEDGRREVHASPAGIAKPKVKARTVTMPPKVTGHMPVYAAASNGSTMHSEGAFEEF